MTTLVLGASGYVGQAFCRELQLRGEPLEALSRSQLDYTQYDLLARHLETRRPAFVINAAGYTGKPNVDACENARADTLQGNTLLPLTISHACAATGTPWGHVSSGCIYNGAMVDQGSGRRIESDLMTPAVRDLAATNPAAIHGFRESDEPNFSFRRPPCSFYSGTKALAEEALRDDPQVYVWRLRIPFNEVDGSRNFLSKLQRYAKVYDNVNSISHLGDYVRACLELWRRRAPFGIYNVTNPGFVTSRQVVEMIQRMLRPPRRFEFWQDDNEFYRMAATTPRSNCVLDSSKLLAAGVEMRSVEVALTDALSRWQPER
jgi:dTDP-4-dehydrorhamnose reductase